MTSIIKYANIISIEIVLLEILLKKFFAHNICNILSLALLMLCVSSCKNNAEPKLVYTENNTIKQDVKNKEQNITWTFELEEKRLSQTINRGAIEIGIEVPYGKELYKLKNFVQNPVYPSIEEFGSLDTSNLKVSVKNKIDSFLEAFTSEEHSGADAFFNKKYLFNYIFFINDFESGWKKNFSKVIPKAPDLFTKWIFGQPFNGSDIIQIPVRFYTSCGTIDMTMFINSTGKNDFYQITIDRWDRV